MGSEATPTNTRENSLSRRLSTTLPKEIVLLLMVVVAIMWYGTPHLTNILEATNPGPRNGTSLIRIRPYRCALIIEARNKSCSRVRRPPWFNLIINSARNNSISPFKRVFYLTTWNNGRLANQLFAYASLFGIAWRNSRIPLWNNDEYGLRGIFSRLRIPADHNGRHRKDQFTTIYEEDTFPTRIIAAAEKLPPSNIHLHGYLQFFRYFAHVEDQLRYDFTFSSDVINEARNTLEVFNASSLRKEGFVRVVTHVRRTDMLDYIDHSLFKQLLKYLNRSMAYFTDCLPKVHFIVISDDIPWCRRRLRSFGGHRVDFIEGQSSPGVDLAIASLCDHAIVTFGTFGWWSAWFANGVTLVFSQDFIDVKRPPHSLSYLIVEDDIRFRVSLFHRGTLYRWKRISRSPFGPASDVATSRKPADVTWPENDSDHAEC